MKTLSCIILAFWCCSAHCQEFGLTPFFGIGLNNRYSPVVSVNNIPENIRLVPVHPGDKNLKTENGPIGEGNYSFSGFVPAIYLRAGLAAELRFGSVRLQSGVQWAGYMTFDRFLDKLWNEDYNKEGLSIEMENYNSRNYLNHPGTRKRGIGAALTFYALRYSYEYVPMYFVEIGFNKNIIEGKAVYNQAIGIKYFPVDLFLKTGWDRYNKLETMRTYTLSSWVSTLYYVFESSYDKNQNPHERLRFVLELGFITNTGMDYGIKFKSQAVLINLKIEAKADYFIKLF